MRIDELLKGYTGVDFTPTYNQRKAPVNAIGLFADDAEEINRLYNECLTLYNKGIMSHTILNEAGNPSKSTFHYTNNFNSYHIDANNGKAIHRLFIIRKGIIYKFIIKTVITDDVTKVNGWYAWNKIIKIAKKKFPEAYEEIQKYIVSKDELPPIKDTFEDIYTGILNPSIKLDGTVYKNCFQIDLNSAYPSGMCATHPKLKPLIEYIYNKRFEDGTVKYRGIKLTKKDYWKAILNRFWGYCQSEYNNTPCPQLAKDALAWAITQMRQLNRSLRDQGFMPLIACTDAIWAQSFSDRVYHDGNEGSTLGQWKCEKSHCELRIKGPKGYDYRYKDENDSWQYHLTLAGKCNLEKVIPREKWTWEDNYLFSKDGLSDVYFEEFVFDVNKGYIRRKKYII